MTSFQNSLPNSPKINTFSLASEVMFSSKNLPKSSILKKKTLFSAKNMINSEEIGEKSKEKVKLSFETPIQKTYFVENWKEYNIDASKYDELCICALF